VSVQWVRRMHVRVSENADHLSDDAIVLSVDGKLCIGRCKGCGKPILTEDDYSVLKDRKIFCGQCVRAKEASRG
jgi:hypothetical protein